MRKFAPALLLSLLTLFGCGGNVVIISDTISPVGPLALDAGQSVTITATVVGDSSNSGVVWQLTGAGTLSAQTATSVVYTAPATVATANSSVVLAIPAKNDLYSAATVVNYAAAPAITSTTLPAGTVGAAYNTQLAYSGGSGAVSFSLVSGTLPAGLTLSSTGVISGTPTAAVSSTLTVRVTDSAATPLSTSAVLALNVSGAPLSIPAATLTNAVAGKTYSATLANTGGVAPFTWKISGGALPAGLTLSSAGVISGVPTIAGNYSFTASVTDTEPSPQTASRAYTLTVYTALAITSSTLPSGAVKNAYTTTLTSTGGTLPVTWTVASGSTLPAGLALNSTTGTISGTPTTAGNYSVTIQAADTSVPQQAVTMTYTLTVVLSTLAISTTSLPQGTVSAGYSTTLQSTGGNAPVTWSLATGSSALPAGLTLSSAGVISGTPTTAGNYSITVQATDSTPASVTKTLALPVVALAALTISSTSLPAGNIGAAYSSTLAATGGATPYTWTVASGTLPVGLSLSTAGVLSGTPLAAGSYTFTLQLADSESPVVTTSRQFTVAIGTTLAAGAGNSALSGGYGFLLNGFANGSASGKVYGFAAIGSITADGAGNITGIEDINTASGVQQSLAVTGSYTLGTDNRGLMVLTAGGTTTVYAVAASNLSGSIAQNLALTEFDNASGTGSTATGFAKRQNAAAFSAASIKGNFVFGLSGESPCSSCASSPRFGPVAAVGVFTADGAATLSAGQEDAAAYGTNYTGLTLAGSFTTPSTSNGRGTMKLTPTGTIFVAAPTDYTYVIVSANELLLLSTDTHASNTLLYGDVQLQQQTTYSAASLTGRSIGYESQASGGDGSALYPSALNATLTQLTNTGSGTATLAQDSNRAGTFATTAATAITYATATNGRTVVTTGGATNLVLYLYNTGAGFALDQAGTSTYPAIAQYELQVAVAPLPTLLSGAYAADTLAAPAASTVSSGEEVFTLSTGGVNSYINGALSTSLDSSSPSGTLAFGQTASLLFLEDATGRNVVTTTTSTTPTAIIYAITSKRAVSIPATTAAVPVVTVLQQ
ncbi:Putative Ig domain-containing protein [Granulicella rosea]|uniref:Putative Ig domain-containing protein n=1 Tax=Granulicella rosea TaxID=474952 RepID=A0A239EF81_9BACT|nr:putative Ig domain-containing protein [Granulicella rosea]SNS43420.1 Putative Ig domain-containing protein [Granulicella rosea]